MRASYKIKYELSHAWHMHGRTHIQRTASFLPAARS